MPKQFAATHQKDMQMFHSARRLAAVCAILSLGILGGCATAHDPRDPLEPINRGVYKFNDGLDTVLLKPAAEIYQGVVPPVARTGVSNVFNNLSDIVVALNNLLQGKFSEAASDAGRVLINTTAGLFGIFDVATPVGLEKHDEDFGQTLGYWGIGNGPYLVLPLIGPRTLRDTAGLAVDWQVDSVVQISPPRSRNQVWALRTVSRRADLLNASNLLSVAALDEYEFVRDAYLQRRHNLIHDGNPPREKEAGVDMKPLLGAPTPAPANSGETNAREASGHTGTAATEKEAAAETPEQLRPDVQSQSDVSVPAAVAAATPRTSVRVWLP
jgi:phospholipid-binding lipoprotein MlaA